MMVENPVKNVNLSLEKPRKSTKIDVETGKG